MAKLIWKDIAEAKTWLGKELPPGEWLIVTQEMINNFAKATMDFQWIHVDVEKSMKHSPFKKPVAHGFLSVSLLSKLLEDVVKLESLQMGVNYGLNKVRFPQAVLVDSRVRLHTKIANIEPYGENGSKIFWDCKVEIENSEKPACIAEFITLMFE